MTYSPALRLEQRKFAWVLFDLDGTLANSIEVLYKVYTDFLNAYGAHGSRSEFNVLGGSVTEIVNALKRTHQLCKSQEALEAEYQMRITEAYLRYVQPYPEAEELLQTLIKKGYKLALVTSAHRNCVNAFLKQHRWRHYFNLVVCGNEVPKAKPAPYIYHLACQMKKIERDSALAVEDSLQGFQSAINAGLYCIRVDHRHTRLQDVLPILEGTKRIDYAQAYDIVTTGLVHLKHVTRGFSISPDTSARVERIWTKETAKNPHLFNGQLFTLLGLHKTDKYSIVEGTFIDYKLFLAQLREPLLDLNIKPLGVSGLTILNSKGSRKILFAVRDETTTPYPGYLELVPSGTLSASWLQADGTIDYRAALSEEFSEETGLVPETITRLQPLGLIFDRKNQVYDICIIIDVDVDDQHLLDSIQKVSEYHKPCLVPLEHVPRFVQENAHIIVPTSLALLKLFFTHSPAKKLQFTESPERRT